MRLKLLQIGLCALLWIATFYMILGDGWRYWTSEEFQRRADERFHQTARDMFHDVDRVTEAKIYLLMGTEEQKTDQSFPIKPYGETVPVHGVIQLTGEELSSLLKVWRDHPLYYPLQAQCHYPAYGFRLYRGSRLVTETSICWMCYNFCVGDRWYGFDADSEAAQRLLHFCDQRLPYARPKNPVEEP